MSLEVKIEKSFDGFTLDVEFGSLNETVGLLGASGCGKSMTLRCIAGIVRPDKGRIVVDGTVLFDSAKGIDLPPQKRRVGLLFQNYALFPNMTVRRNIFSVLNLGEKRDREKRFASLVERFHLGGLENHYPQQLSGGQQQRTALARIMAGSPGILMLDEPLSALDSWLRWQLESELAQALEGFEGTTLYVSHNRDEVYRLCQKVCVMSDGRNEPLRTVRELFECPNTLASSLLSGCKNYSRVVQIDAHTLHATDWDTDLRCDIPVGDEVGYLGVRAHYVKLSAETTGKNVFPCRVLRVVEDVFSTIVSLRPLNAPSEGDFSRIRMELPKGKEETLVPGDVVPIAIDPKDIMPLQK